MENKPIKTTAITNVPNLVDEINAVYSSPSLWESKKAALMAIFERVELSTHDVNKVRATRLASS